MITTQDSIKKLYDFFYDRRVADLNVLYKVLNTQSRMTVFRRLKVVGYRSSFSHGGKYYTLSEIPKYDDHGLWFFNGIGFSSAGTLKETIIHLVNDSPIGHTHSELQCILHLRAHNTLLELVTQKQITRADWRNLSLYLSPIVDRAQQQIEQRNETAQILAEASKVLTTEEIIEVLIEALREAPAVPPAALVSRRLISRNLRIEPRLVDEVYQKYNLVPGKKKPALKPSPP